MYNGAKDGGGRCVGVYKDNKKEGECQYLGSGGIPIEW